MLCYVCEVTKYEFECTTRQENTTTCHEWTRGNAARYDHDCDGPTAEAARGQVQAVPCVDDAMLRVLRSSASQLAIRSLSVQLDKTKFIWN